MKHVMKSQCQLKNASLNKCLCKSNRETSGIERADTRKGLYKAKGGRFQVQGRQQRARDKGERLESLGCTSKTTLVWYQIAVLKQYRQDISKIVWIIWTSFSDVKFCKIRTTAHAVWEDWRVVRTFSWYGCSRFLITSNRLHKQQCSHKD